MYKDLNDIIPPSRRRQMDMPPAPVREPQTPSMDMPARSHAATPPPPPPPSHEPPVAVPPMMPTPRRKFRSTGGFPIGTALIALVVIAVCAGVLYAFAGAKVTIIPVTNATTVSADMSATAGQGDLPFQQITVTKTATANVPSESTVTANDPASGTITIANSQTKPQALIKNTRFESANGLIFRIHDSVSIPAGGATKVTVYADEAGAKYNIAPTTFTVPGLKGSSSFTQVTAKSDAPMAGGFSGTRPSVAQATKDAQYAQIQGKVSADMQKDLAAKIPQGYVLIPGASFTSFAPGTDAAGPSGTVTLSETGTVVAIVFPADALARTIAFKSVGTYGGQPVTLAGVNGLTVKPAQTSIAPDATQFDFNLSGNTTVVWQVDPAKIAGVVAGKTRSTAQVGLQTLPEVQKATLVLRPFWASTFPGDPSKIKVVVSAPSAGK